MAEELGVQLSSQRIEDGVAEEDEVDDFVPIDKLETMGINKGDIKKAKEGGFYTCQSLLMNTKKRLTEIKGLSEAKIDKMLEAAKKMCVGFGWKSAAEEERLRSRDIVHISTGCQAVNELLNGGIETKAITEIFGEWRTGKTQLCHTLCVTTQLPVEDGGGAGKAAYIDSEGTFRPDRIRAIADRFGLEADAVLNNIVLARTHTFEQQILCLRDLCALMAEEPFKLVIVDSIAANLRTDYCGRGELAERQQKLGYMMKTLKNVAEECTVVHVHAVEQLVTHMQLAEEFNVAIVITNQVISDPSGGAMFVADPKKPVGGHVMAHASTIRLSVRKGKGEQRLLKVVDAPNLPEAEASYMISNQGIADYKD